MDILKMGGVVIAVLVVLTVLGGLFEFTQHCQEKFGHALFTKESYICTMVAVALGLLGRTCLESAIKHHGDPFWAWVWIVIAVLILIVLVAINFKNMNFACGLAGSILQLSVLIPLAMFGLVILVAYLALLCINNSTSTESEEEREERQSDEDAWLASDVNPNGPNYKE
jgi:amino acid transporter